MRNKKALIISILTMIFVLFGTVSIYATNEVEDPEQERKDNNFLSSITTENYELSPEFNKNIFTYYLVIPSSVTSIPIEATTEIEEAKIKITGNDALTRNENTIKIVVTSISGKTRTYSIIVNKQDPNGLHLTSLNIEGGTLTTEFDPLKYYYTADVKIVNEDKSQIDNTVENTDLDLADINISAEANVEDAQIEIIGNKNLKSGENVISIILKDGERVTNYELIVNLTVEKEIFSKNKEGKIVDSLENVKNQVAEFFQNEQNQIYVLSGVAVVLVLIIIIVIVKMHKRKNNKENKE